jgi:hypothetical protein
VLGGMGLVERQVGGWESRKAKGADKLEERVVWKEEWCTVTRERLAPRSHGKENVLKSRPYLRLPYRLI